MAPLAALTSVTPREAITDTINRLLIGLDRNDLETFKDAFTGEEATMELLGHDRIILENRSAIVTRVFDLVGPMDSIHQIGNIRVDLKDGSDAACFTAYVWAQHAKAGQGRDPASPKYSVGAEYVVDLVRNAADGSWKVKKFVLEVIWNDGDPTVMAKPV